MKKRLLSVAIGATLATVSVAANAIEAKLSGQINRALMSVDDGASSELFHVDNANSSTRFRFTGSADVAPGVKGGVVFEAEYRSAPSSAVTFADRDGASPTLDERHMNVYFQGPFGYASLGQGDGAANGGVEVDLSGTSVAHYADVAAIGGAFSYGGTGPTIANTISGQDFESRYDRLRYDTPSFGGAKAALSVGTRDNTRDVTEVALWYAGKFGGGHQLAGALGISKKDTATPAAATFDQDNVGGSVSWLAPMGLNVTFATSTRDVAANREGKFSYLKVGYKTGNHAVSADYGKGEDQAASGDEAKMMGLAYVYSPTKWAEIFVAAKEHSLDRPGSNFDDVQIIMAGSRLKF